MQFDDSPDKITLKIEHTLAVLRRQSKIGRRVMALLTYLAEHGASPQATLAQKLPGGLKGEFNTAYRHDYVARREGSVVLLEKGWAVVHWVSGLREEPNHWKQWEDAARIKQSLTEY